MEREILLSVGTKLVTRSRKFKYTTDEREALNSLGTILLDVFKFGDTWDYSEWRVPHQPTRWFMRNRRLTVEDIFKDANKC